MNIWAGEPVFHAYDVGRPWTEYPHSDFTLCGWRIALAKPWLPFKHVVKFGRPCKGCFPEGV